MLVLHIFKEKKANINEYISLKEFLFLFPFFFQNTDYLKISSTNLSVLLKDKCRIFFSKEKFFSQYYKYKELIKSFYCYKLKKKELKVAFCFHSFDKNKEDVRQHNVPS